MHDEPHPFWRAFGSDRETLVVFAHGTCVIADQPTRDPAGAALATLARFGTPHVGSEAGDVGVIPIGEAGDAPLGWLVTSYRPEIVTFLPSSERPTPAPDPAPTWVLVGLAGRANRGRDSADLRIVAIDHRTPPSRERLIAAMADGYRADLLPFFGLTDDPRKAVMSQWWPSPFEVEGVVYATAEHYMMAEKARLFGDEATRAAILRARDPATAKTLGRRVTPYSDEVWAAHRFDVVVRGNLAKFGQDEALFALLAATWPSIPVEASPFDRIWGIGLGEDDPGVAAPALWPGDNLLGFALSEVRRRLMNQRWHR